MSNRRIVVFGADTKIGIATTSAVLTHDLFSEAHTIRAFSKHQSSALRRLKLQQHHKFQIFIGDPTHRESVSDAIGDSDTLILIQNTADFGPDYISASEKEVEYARMILDEAANLSVRIIIYASFAGCERDEVPHLRSKCLIEEELNRRRQQFENISIVRSTFFYENLINTPEIETRLRIKHQLCLPLHPETTLPVVSLVDFGRVLADVAYRPSILEQTGFFLELCAESIKCLEMAEMLSVPFVQCPDSDISNEEFQKLYKFLRQEKIKPDLESVKKLYPNLLKFQDFVDIQKLKSSDRTQLDLPVLEGAGIY
ncbi:hypothetical protein GEMRC1_002861 [Eukaryota sp. GEM-RC1]